MNIQYYRMLQPHCSCPRILVLRGPWRPRQGFRPAARWAFFCLMAAGRRACPTCRSADRGEHRAMQPLRRIAVTVIEEEEGAYRWRLIELEGEGWHVLAQQARSMKTY